MGEAGDGFDCSPQTVFAMEGEFHHRWDFNASANKNTAEIVGMDVDTVMTGQ
jgi:hypothetical protein